MVGWGWVLPEGSARCPHHLALSPASSALRMSVGPPSSAACPQTPASRPASTATRRVTVRTAATSSAAVSEELGGELWALAPPRSLPTPAPSSSRLGASHPSLLLAPSPVPPQVVTPPQELIQASRGQTVTFTCVAIGVPTPIINWRLNWGHIPSHPRCGSGSRQGAGAGGEVRPAVPAQPLPLVSGGAHQGDSDQ